jgi:hypothetical protein
MEPHCAQCRAEIGLHGDHVPHNEAILLLNIVLLLALIKYVVVFVGRAEPMVVVSLFR